MDNVALYITANMFQFGGGFKYAKIRVVPKLSPYAGAPIQFVDFVNLKNADGSVAFTVQPCHTYGAPQVQSFVNSYYPSTGASTKNKLTLWSMTGVQQGSPQLGKKTISTDPYGLPPDAVQKGAGYRSILATCAC